MSGINTGTNIYTLEDRDEDIAAKLQGEYVAPLTSEGSPTYGILDLFLKFIAAYAVNPYDPIGEGFDFSGAPSSSGQVAYENGDSVGYLIEKIQAEVSSGITITPVGTTNKVMKFSLNIQESESTSLISLLKDSKTLKKLVAGTNIELTSDENEIIIKYKDNLTKESTGFKFEVADDIISEYDPNNYTITLTGTVEAYYQNEVIPELVDGWTSEHIPVELRNSTSDLFLYYNGTDFVWSLIPWKYYELQIAVVVKDELGNFIGAMKETHSFMDWESHRRFHETIGTTLASGNEVSNIVLESTVVSDRRPVIAETVLGDEDLYTTLPALTNSIYSIGYIQGTSFIVVKDNTDIIPLSGNIPFYNKDNNGTWGQAQLTDGQYMNVWMYCTPATVDEFSQKARYVFVQGQNVFNTLESALGNNIQDLYLNGADNLFPELVFSKRFVVRYKDLNWFIADYENVEGSRNTQISSVSRTNKTGGLIVNKPSTESYSRVAETQNVVNEEFNQVINVLVNTVSSLAGASSNLEATVPKVITTTPSVVAYTTLVQSTNEDVFVLNDTTESILVKKAGIYQWLYKLNVDNSTQATRTLTLSTRNKSTLAIISSSNISIPKEGLQGSFTTQITIPSDNTNIEVIAYGSGTGLTILYAGANFILNQTDVPLYVYKTDGIDAVLDAETLSGDVDGKTQQDINIENVVAINGKEPIFSKNTAFNKNFGTIAGTVSEGNHTHTFDSLTSKPNTISGFGITDAYTKTEIDNDLSDYRLLTNNMFTSDLTVSKSSGETYINVENTSDTSYSFFRLLNDNRHYDLGIGGSNVLNTNVINSIYIASTNGLNVIFKPDLSTVFGGDIYVGADKLLSETLASTTYEPIFSKNTAFNKNFGTIAGTVAEGNHKHSRIESIDSSKYIETNDATNIQIKGQATIKGVSSIEIARFHDSGITLFKPVNVTNNKITGVANGTSTQDAVNFGQLSTKLDTSLKGSINGLAELDGTGKVPSNQLPSYVDDVITVADFASLPTTGESGKIYITIDTNLTYRWSGIVYVEISKSLALGETSSTAYRGDRGKIAYDHSQFLGNPHGTDFSELENKPNTISGFGITDAYTKTESDTNYIKALGETRNITTTGDIIQTSSLGELKQILNNSLSTGYTFNRFVNDLGNIDFGVGGSNTTETRVRNKLYIASSGGIGLIHDPITLDSTFGGDLYLNDNDIKSANRIYNNDNSKYLDLSFTADISLKGGGNTAVICTSTESYLRSNGNGYVIAQADGGVALVPAVGKNLNISNVPTSATGLSSGDVWNDSGTLKIV